MTMNECTSYLYKLPCNSVDKGTQKCRIGPAMFSKLRCPVGSYIKISLNEPPGFRHIVCSTWPRKDCKDGYIEYDESVISHCDTCTIDGNFVPGYDIVSPDKISRDVRSVSRIDVLNTIPCTSISASVVAENIECLKQLKKINKECPHKLQSMSRNCLVNMCVINNSIVECCHNNIAKVYGIHRLSIENMDDNLGMIINDDTKVSIISIISKEKHQQNIAKNILGELGGLKNEIEHLTEIMLHSKNASSTSMAKVCVPQGILLYGPPGCGKTSLVRLITQQADAYLISITGSDIIGSRPGESELNLEEHFQNAIDLCEDELCIIFVDEIDSLCPKRRVDSNNSNSLTSQFLVLVDKLKDYPNVKLIAATNRPTALDPAIRRPGRFDREIIISTPNTSQRFDILAVLTKNLPIARDVDLEALAGLTKGYVGADLQCLCHEAAYACLSDSRKLQIDSGEIMMRHFKHALSTVTPSTQRGCDALVDSKPISWSDIGGLDEVKWKVIQAVEWPIKHPESFSRLGLPQPKGVLLYGPPGCCKTTLVRAAASASGATFFSLSSAQLYSPYVGEAERALTEAFQQARLSQPSILFLDEIDAVVGKRSDEGVRGVQERVLSTLLNEMDGIGLRVDRNVTRQQLLEGDRDMCDFSQGPETNHGVNNNGVLVVAATNRPDMVDEAVLRPGRFDFVIYVPPPDCKAREEILKVHTRNMPLCKDVDLHKLAEQSDMFTGADLENLCKEAALYALTRKGLQADSISCEHFDHVLSTYQPSLTPATLAQYTSPKFKNL